MNWLDLQRAALGVLAAAITVLTNCACDEGPGSVGVVSTSGSAAMSGPIAIDGSATVFPISQAMAEDFGHANPNCELTVNASGTVSGFQKFVRGESEISNASRPIETKEVAELKANGTEFMEIPIAFDGISVIVNPQNTWVDKLTMEELRRAWNSKSSVACWSDIRPGFPKERIEFHGPTDSHGTFEYFTEAVDGKDGDIRKDCQLDQEYNSIVQAVAGDRDAIGYVGFNYFDQNKDKVKIVPIDSGGGPVVPSEKTISDGLYTPLSRPLFFYVSKRAYDTKPQVKSFVKFALSDQGAQDVRESSYVVLPKDLHNEIAKRIAEEKTGTAFETMTPGTRLSQVYEASGAK